MSNRSAQLPWLLILSIVMMHGVGMPAGAFARADEQAGDADDRADAPHPSGTADRAVGQDRKELARLAAIAQGTRWPEAREALAKLDAFGEAAAQLQRRAVEHWLLHDRLLIYRNLSALPDLSQLQATQRAMDQRRGKALAHLRGLDADGVGQAAAHRRALLQKQQRMAPDYARVAAVAQAMARRSELLSRWQRLEPADQTADAEARLVAESERDLRDDVAALWGLSVPQMVLATRFNLGRPPADEAIRGLWFYIACREIEHYNAEIEHLMDPQERINANLLNAYREALGLLPLEFDARLIQAARRHSREMLELGYFSHTSPTPANATPIDRMRNAGYPRPYGENIAYGRPDGQWVFQQWFNSPAHHRNMCTAQLTALGVGRWRDRWTQKFGFGPRLMLLPPAAREAIEVKGPILEPDRTPIPPRPRQRARPSQRR